VNSLANVAGVFAACRSSVAALGSSTSFSTLTPTAPCTTPTAAGARLAEDKSSQVGGKETTGLGRGGPDRAASGRDELGPEGADMDAWAVLAEMEEVGGPDMKIARFGVENTLAGMLVFVFAFVLAFVFAFALAVAGYVMSRGDSKDRLGAGARAGLAVVGRFIGSLLEVLGLALVSTPK